MQTTQVTIIGGGPTGLLAAATLLKNGVNIRIFESKAQRSIFSRALAIHAGTMEYLEAIHPQLLQKILAAGKVMKKARIADKYDMDFHIIDSKYNYILSLEQDETERLLEEYLESLGGKLERGCELVDANNYIDKVEAIIQTTKEKIFVTSDYLIDCSGAHSVIRKNVLKIPFEGEKYLGLVTMGDVKIKSKISHDFINVTGNENGIAGFIPLNKDDFFRVILIPHIAITVPQKITIEYFKNLSAKIAPKVELDDENKWLTTFEISKRMVSKLRVGRIFLAGDAAHIHSPVGGQGMNIGMHDALNISLKLKKVLQDAADEKILDDYEKERMPVIKNVLRLTNALMRSGVEPSFLSKIGFFIIKTIISPIFFNCKFLRKKLFTTVSLIKPARAELARLK